MDVEIAGRPRAVVAHHDTIVRQALKAALVADGIAVVAEVASGREAVALAIHYRPDAVLLDAMLSDMTGVEATRRILDAAPRMRVVVMAAGADDELRLDALRSGAVGVAEPEMGLEHLIAAVRGVARGRAALSPAFTMRLIAQYRSLSDRVADMRPIRSVLTPREWEVLDLLATGATVDEAADELRMEPATVRSHTKKAMRKLNVRTRAEALAVIRSERGHGQPGLEEAPA